MKFPTLPKSSKWNLKKIFKPKLRPICFLLNHAPVRLQICYLRLQFSGGGFVSFMSLFRFEKCFTWRKHSEIKTSINVTNVTFMSHFRSNQETFKGYSKQSKATKGQQFSKCVKKLTKLTVLTFLHPETVPPPKQNH